jgi:hypothetical protein
MAANGSEKEFCVLIFRECRSVAIVQRQFCTKFGKEHHLTIPLEGGMHSFNRQGACVKGKAPPLKQSITANMLQTNSIIVLMFVGSQTVHT